MTGRLMRRQPSPPTPAPSRSLLTWAPPSGWESYTPLDLSTDTSVFLDNNTDYRITTTTKLTTAVDIVGGRNIVWPKGHVEITDSSIQNHAVHRGLRIRDIGGEVDGRVVHIEGVRFGGPDLREGIVLDGPTAIVQLANCRVDEVIVRGADDRDGTGAYAAAGASHPDIVQTYGSMKELRIDGLTGRSNYQGLFFKEDHTDRVRGPIYLRRVNIEATEKTGVDGYTYAGNRMYFWDAGLTGQQFLDTGTVWVEHHANAGKVAATPNPRSGSGSWWQDAYRDSGGLVAEPVPGTAVFTDALESDNPFTAPTSSSDSTGTYATWPTATVAVNGLPGVRNFTNTAAGRVYSGTPPSGDYVPIKDVGLSYVSPGYRR